MLEDQDTYFMRQAIALSIRGVAENEGGPFGAIVVQNNVIVGVGNNQVTSTNDPTAHAEVVAIRDACKNLESFQLADCTIYTSCEPCPMCLGAIYWARPKRIVYACTKKDAAKYDFDDAFIYKELKTPIAKRKIPTDQLLRKEALVAFKDWKKKKDKTAY